MGQCIGYGKYKGNCPNCTDKNNLIFCPRCAKLKKADAEKRLQKESQERDDKLAMERE